MDINIKNMENLINLTNAQLSLIIAEKIAPIKSQNAKRESDIIDSANILLKWLNDNTYQEYKLGLNVR